MPSQTIDLTQNTTDCVHAVLDVGATTYQNICTGAVTTIGWGTGDWIVAGGIAVFVLVILFVMIAMGALILAEVLGF